MLLLLRGHAHYSLGARKSAVLKILDARPLTCSRRQGILTQPEVRKELRGCSAPRAGAIWRGCYSPGRSVSTAGVACFTGGVIAIDPAKRSTLSKQAGAVVADLNPSGRR